MIYDIIYEYKMSFGSIFDVVIMIIFYNSCLSVFRKH